MKIEKRLLLGGASLVLAAGAAGFGLAMLTRPAAPPHLMEPAGAEAGGSRLAMTDAVIRAAGVVVRPVAAGGLAHEILSQGTVVAAPGGEAVLTARASGTVTHILKQLGDTVRPGEGLAIVESRDAAQITADQATAGAKDLLARRNLAREQALYDQRVSPRVDLERAEAEAAAARAEARRARISAGAANVTADGRGVIVTSPIAGRITQTAARLGAYVQPDNPLFRITDPRRIRIETPIAGPDIERLAPGDQAVIETADGQAITAQVRAVTPVLDAETRAATAILEVADARLTPGQAVRVRLFPKRAAAGAAIVVPDEAVQSHNGHDVVFVRTATGFEARPVIVGARSAGRVEIVSGLAAGQSIAAKNAFLLKAELGKTAGGEH